MLSDPRLSICITCQNTALFLSGGGPKPDRARIAASSRSGSAAPRCSRISSSAGAGRLVDIGPGEKFDQGSGKELPVGGFVSVPPKHPHYARAGPQETVVQVHGVGPTDLTFVNPADDPRKK
jgi:hypothetical protein